MADFSSLRVVLLAGGVGGAKLATGLAQHLPPTQYTIIGNTGDDFVHLGLTICPDLDTLLYTLAGQANPDTGWGRKDETWQAMSVVRELGGPAWFNLGDRDLGLHLTRTHRLRQGQTLTTVTDELARALGVTARLLPMSDAPAPTWVETDQGVLPFQAWFVRERWQPRVRRVILPDAARATHAAIQALEAADVVIIAPSNPYVSIDPILNAYPIRPILADVANLVIAVSPIIAGEAVKGPSAKMMREWGLPVTAGTVAAHYGDLLDAFVYDSRDGEKPTQLPTLCTDTLMHTAADRARLAAEILAFAAHLTAET